MDKLATATNTNTLLQFTFETDGGYLNLDNVGLTSLQPAIANLSRIHSVGKDVIAQEIFGQGEA
jgi:hypothetical protein